MNKKNKLLSLITSFLIALLVFPSFINTTKADIMDVGNWSGMIDPLSSSVTSFTMDALSQFLDSFNLSEDSFEEIGEYLNTSSTKVQAPEVQLLFSPTSPSVGDEITATALPKFFRTSTENLYFTWYLKHEDDEDNTDHNGDGEIDIEDYKLEAMRVITNGGYRSERATYANPWADTDDDGFGPLESYVQNGIITDEICDELNLDSDECAEGVSVEENINTICANAGDDDMAISVCTKSPFGASNAKEPTDGFRCYVHDFESGTDYEIVEEGNGEQNDACPTIHEDEETDTYDHDFDIDNVNYASGSTISSNETSTLTASDSGSNVDFEHSLNMYLPDDFGDDDKGCAAYPTAEWARLWIFYLFDGGWYGYPNDMLHGDSYLEEYEIAVCDDSPIPEDWEWNHCNEEKGLNCYTPPVGETVYFALANTSCVSGDNSARTEAAEYTWNYDWNYSYSGETSICTHLFPHVNNAVTGDNSFPEEEEQRWATNPNDADTDGDGTGDEASAAGVGQDTFTWTYNEGDEVGVAVEGESMNTTKHDDSSYMIMWALSDNTFSVDGSESDCEIRNVGSYTKTIKGEDIEIDTATIDINACLEENFTDPLTGGQAEKMEVTLTASPDNPYNDSSGSGNKNGDTVYVQSTISNSNTDNLYYSWHIEGSTEFSLDNDDWTDISTDVGAGMTEGIKKDEINFSLNLAQDTDAYNTIFGTGDSNRGYIRVQLEVEEDYDSSSNQYGTGQVVLQVTSGQNNLIEISRAGINEDGTLFFDADARLCESDTADTNTTTCEVANNEIVAARVTNTDLRNFSWTLNEEKIECTSDISDSCNDTKQTSTTFFPIMGTFGDKYTLNLEASDINVESDESKGESTGLKTNITQKFKIVKPEIKLGPEGGTNADCTSVDTAGFEAKELGYYTDLKDDTQIYDCSDKIYTGTPGELNIEAFFSPNWIEDYAKDIVWTVNGETVAANEDGTITTNAEEDDTVNVSISGKYSQSDDTKRALMTHWGVSQLSFSDTSLSNSIKIKITEEEGVEMTDLKKTTNIMASLVTNLPTQMLFMFRIMLTVVTVIFISGSVFALGRERV